MAEGYRSLLGFWAGGAASVNPTPQGGYRSLFAFWFGGACSVAYTAPEVIVPTIGGGGGGGGWLYPGYRQVKRENDDEVILTILFNMIASGDFE